VLVSLSFVLIKLYESVEYSFLREFLLFELNKLLINQILPSQEFS